MSNFMGPMAPPPAAPAQPQALDFQTDPNQRQRFKQFMRQRMQPPMPQMPAPMPQPMPTVPAGSYIFPDMDIFAPQPFADGGSVSDALADALSNDIGDYAVDDTMTDLSQTSYNDFDPGGNDSFDASAMNQFRNQQVSDLSNTIGQQIQNVIGSNQQMGTPAPVPQSTIEQMQFENLQNVPTTAPVFSAPSLNLGGQSASFDLLGNPLTIGFEDGGSVPPRRTEIGGNDHMLSYITPDEADILMALGGSGEAGPMGIPSFNPNEDRANEEAAADDDMGDSDTMSGPSGNDDGPDPFAGEEGDDFSDPNQNYGNDDGSFNPSDFVDYGETALDKAIATTNAINTANQQRFNNLDQRLAQTQLDPMRTLTNPNNEILDFDAGPVVGDIEVNSIGGVNTGASKGTSSANNLLGDVDDLLGSLDKAINKVSTPTPSETIVRSMNDRRMQNNQLGAVTPEVLGMTDQDTEEDANYVGGAKVGSRFGTATGPGRLSTVTAEEMEALRTGNPVQRQMYRQLAGIKSAGPVLSSYDPNDVEGNFLDTIFGMTNKPSSAVEVFRAPITEQQGFKSVNTGNFKDGISGVTGMGNMPGVMGGIMQMFGIDPIVYTGDSRFDPNRPPEGFGGGGDDNILLPLKPEEVVPESTDPNQMGGIGAPGTPIAAGPVLVPSTRTSTPISGQMPVGYGTTQTGQINPYSLSEMQRYQQMLARLGQARSPIGLAEGGSVLDAAAGKFLESLTAA